MTDPTPTPRDPAETVRAFLAALERLDLDAAETFLAPDVLYENVSMTRARGRDAAMRTLRMFIRPCRAFEATVHRLAADGPLVMTERTDALVVGRVRFPFWVCGTFEVHDGRITLWRDYFDYADAARGLAGGLGRAALSLLRGNHADAGSPTRRGHVHRPG